MVEVKSKSVTSGQSTRIGNHMLAFGAYRFERKDYGKSSRAIWQFEIAHTCGGKTIYEAVLSGADLREMQRVIGSLAEMVEADGNHPKDDDKQT